MNPTTERYRGDAGWRYQEDKRAVPPAAYPWVAQARAELFQAHVRPQDVVFEFGVGLGWNLAALRCGRRIGYDLVERAAGVLIEHGIEFSAGLPAVGEPFADVILSHHTLEHVPDPAGTLRLLHGWLRPGGRLLLGVPWEREWRTRRFVPDEPNHHLFTWTAQCLGNLVTDCGFEVMAVGVARYGYDRFAAKAACRAGLGEWGFRMIRRSLQLVRPLREIRLQALRP